MRKFKRFNEEAYTNHQLLSSLVMNTPYTVDHLTTSPQITRFLTLPLGIKLESSNLLRPVFKLLSTLCVGMTMVCLFTVAINFPIQNLNNQLLGNIKSLSNQRLGLKVKLQETTNYKKLIANANALSLSDTENIAYLNIGQSKEVQPDKKIIPHKYPTIFFSGF